MFDLNQLQNEAETLSLHSPYPVALAVAVVNDCFRLADRAPVSDETWREWSDETGEYWSEQLGVIAHLLQSTTLKSSTVEALESASSDRRPELRRFFDRVEPLSGEMIRSNKFRREECLRRWAEWCGGTIEGEPREQSEERLERLDYRKTLEEYERAEAAREEEKEEREKRFAEARSQGGPARGSRE